MSKYPKMQTHVYVPTLSNQEIVKLPVDPDHRKVSYVVTEKGKEYINGGEKS